VDDGVHLSEPVDVLGDRPRLLEVGEVAYDDRRSPVSEAADRGEPVVVADVDDDLVSGVEQPLGRQAAEAVCGACDEDARHLRE